MKVRKLLGISEGDDNEQPVPDFCLPRTAVGLEYEWENIGKFPTNPSQIEQIRNNSCPVTPVVGEVIKYFDQVPDHSLRLNGMEFKFRGGYRGSKILRAIEAMEQGARVFGFEGSYRTSLHVHLDMHDLDFPRDIELFGGLYCIVEPFLYQFVGNNRHACNYCVPWNYHPQHFETFLRTIRENHKEGTSVVMGYIRNGKANKYAGLNCYSLGDYGTVEFRQAPVTFQSPKIISWINLLMRLKQWVIEHPIRIDTLVALADSAGAVSFLEDVFRQQTPEVLRYSKNVESDFWRGMQTLYQYAAT